LPVQVLDLTDNKDFRFLKFIQTNDAMSIQQITLGFFCLHTVERLSFKYWEMLQLFSL